MAPSSPPKSDPSECFYDQSIQHKYPTKPTRKSSQRSLESKHRQNELDKEMKEIE